jgi:hypothetical protein
VRFQRVTRVLNLFLQLCNFVVLPAPEPETRTISRAPCTRFAGSRLPSPYHFPARIQSFQAVAAPFLGDSVFKSRTVADSKSQVPILSSKPPRKGRSPRIRRGLKSSKGTVTRIVLLRNKTHKNRHRPFRQKIAPRARRPARWSPAALWASRSAPAAHRPFRMKGWRTNKPYHIFYYRFGLDLGRDMTEATAGQSRGRFALSESPRRIHPP